MNVLDHIEKSTHPQPTVTIIWLHGFGADASDFLSLIPFFSAEKNLKLRFIFPNAPFRTVPNYPFPVRAWFEINNFVKPIDFNEAHIHEMNQQLNRIIAREKERGTQPNRIFIGGFSQGGMQALFCGLFHPEPLAGVIGLSTVLPPTTKLIQHIPEISQKIPIFLAHGIQDEVVPFSMGETSKQFLIEAHYPVTWKTYTMGHQVNLDELDDVKEWLLQQSL